MTLLRTLVLWSLSSSEVVKGIINQSYKQNRHEDDLNQPLSIQPWGSDSDRRRYFLVEGLDDTHFRVYRESNPAGFNRTWWSIAGSIEELNALCDKLQNADGGPRARKLAQKMQAAIPRFEATEEKRKRREYRLMRKEQFKRPEQGFSMYEGRTRGKRIKYTYSDDEDFYSDSTTRRSTRNTGTHTPAEPTGPVTTASGRQVKAPSRMTVDASNNIVTTSPNQESEDARSKEPSVGPGGRPRRSAAVNHGTNGWTSSSTKKTKGYNSMDDEMDEDEDDSEPDLGDDEEDDHIPDAESEEDEEEEEEEGEGDDEFDEDEVMADEDLDNESESMVVKLKYSPKAKNKNGGGGATLDLDAFRYDGGGGEKGKGKGKSKAKTPQSDAKEEESSSPSADRSEESIAVAMATTASSTSRQTTPKPTTSAGVPALTSLQSTSLAFRESPEKSHQQQTRKSVDVPAK